MRLLPDIHPDEQAGGDAQGEADDVDEGVGLVPGQASEGNAQVVLEHLVRVVLLWTILWHKMLQLFVEGRK